MKRLNKRCLVSLLALCASFAIQAQVNVRVFANDNSMGSVSGSGSYYYGDTVTIVATESVNHHFAGWSNGVITHSQDIVVTSDTTLVANFEIDRHTLTVLANDSILGYVTGSGIYDYGTDVTITATTLHPHYLFNGWSNGDIGSVTTYHLVGNDTVVANFAIDQHTIVLNVNDESMGHIVSGAGTYNHGDTVTVLAAAEQNCHFLRWSNGMSTPSFDLVVDRNDTLTAFFAYDEYILTAIPNDANIGTVSGSGTYYYGDTVTIVATESVNHHFAGWSNGVITNSQDIIVTSDTTLVANFEIDRHTLTVLANDSTLGYVTGSGTYDYGTDVTITATTLHPHYLFNGWSNGDIGSVTTYHIVGNDTVVANFAIDQHTIVLNVNDESMGHIVSGAGSYNHGDTVTVLAAAEQNCHFLRWSNGMSTPSFDLVVDRNDTLTAFFAYDEYILTAIPNDANIGTVSGSGTYYYGDTVSVTAIPAENHYFVGWSNGVLTNPQRINVNSDTIVIANFAINQHSLTIISNDDHLGRVTGSGTYNHGAQVTITASTLDSDYVFLGWSNGLTSRVATIDLICDSTVTAIFSLNEFNVTLNVNDADMGSVTGAGKYMYGDIAIFTAIPAECNHFVGWDDGVTDNPRSFIVVNDLSLTAIFAIDNYTISVGVNDIAAGRVRLNNIDFVDVDTMVTCGSYVELQAVPAEFYRFVEWSDGIKDALRYIEVSADSSLVALYNPNCGDSAAFPVRFYYNGLIMLDMDSIHFRGYDPQPDHVTWYQVVGNDDSLDTLFPIDDQYICNGFYLSLPGNDVGYGKYYAVVDVSGTPQAICNDKMKTIIVEYSGSSQKSKVDMAPTNVRKGDEMVISGLNPDEETAIIVYDYTGKVVYSVNSDNAERYVIHANGAAGVYMVKVSSDSVSVILRYVISE